MSCWARLLHITVGGFDEPSIHIPVHFQIFNVERNTLTNQVPEDQRVTVGGCDLSDTTIIIGTSRSVVHVSGIKLCQKKTSVHICSHLLQEYRIQSLTCDKIKLMHTRESEVNKAETMASLAYTSTDNKPILAIGYRKGLIEVFDCHKDKIQLLQKLSSHKETIYNLRFSPWMDNQTLVLVSVSEMLCFWNVTHMLNNPLDGGNVRRSQRFSRRHSKSSVSSTLDVSPIPSPNEITNGGSTHLTINGYSPSNGTTNGVGNGVVSPVSQLNQSFSNLRLDTNHEQIIVPAATKSSPWTGKSGASTKPELLSCIKFVGNTAEKVYVNQAFTKFITIDSEGEIYYLDINFGENI